MGFWDYFKLFVLGAIATGVFTEWRNKMAQDREYVAERREHYRAFLRALANALAALRLLEGAALKTPVDLAQFQDRHTKVLEAFQIFNGERDIIEFYVNKETKTALNELTSAVKEYSDAVDRIYKDTTGASPSNRGIAISDAIDASQKIFKAEVDIKAAIKKEYQSDERGVAEV